MHGTDKSASLKGSSTALTLGRQLTIDYYDCDPERLFEPDRVQKALVKAADDSGATVVSSSFHRFTPQGTSGVVVIAESHFAVHAWPEHGYAAVDIFTCSDGIDLDRAVRSMADSFAARQTVISSDINRGLIPENILSTRQGMPDHTSGLSAISIKKDFESKNPWGMTAAIDVYGCETAILGCPERLIETTGLIARRLGKQLSGPCSIKADGPEKNPSGLTVVQPMESSLISGHAVLSSRALYLDILADTFFDPRDMAEFCLGLFKASHYRLQLVFRQ